MDNIINRNFNELSAQDRQMEYKAGKYGMVFCVIDDISGLQNDLVQVDAGANSRVLAPITVEKGAEPRISATSGYNGLVMFPKFGDNTIKDEATLRRVLAFMDALCTPEYQDFINFGLEGIHYEVVDGIRTLLTSESGSKVLDAARGDIGQILPFAAYIRRDDDSDMLKDLYDQIEAREAWAVLDDSVGLKSATYNDLSSELDPLMMDAAVNFVTGAITEDDYRAAYQDWLAFGGQDVLDELTAAYETYKK